MVNGGRRRPDFVDALLPTMVALIIYRLGLMIPIPGLDPKFTAGLGQAGGAVLHIPGGNAARTSIFALDIFPLFGILIVAELAKVLVPRLRRWENAKAANAGKLARIVFVVAMFSACLQAGGVASGLEGISGLVAEPGLLFRLSAIATLITATALVTWLATQITRRGLGSGLWLVIVAPTLARLPLTLKEIADLEGQGVVSGPSLVAAAIFTVLAIAAVAALQFAGRQNSGTPSAHAWTAILGYTVLPWVLVALSWLPGARASGDSIAWVEPGHPIRLIVLAALIVMFAKLHANSIRLSGGEAPSVPPVVSGAILAAIAVGSELLPYHLDVPLPLGGQPLLIIAIVVTTLLRDWGNGPLARGVREEINPPPQTGSSRAP